MQEIRQLWIWTRSIPDNANNSRRFPFISASRRVSDIGKQNESTHQQLKNHLGNVSERNSFSQKFLMKTCENKTVYKTTVFTQLLVNHILLNQNSESGGGRLTIVSMPAELRQMWTSAEVMVAGGEPTERYKVSSTHQSKNTMCMSHHPPTSLIALMAMSCSISSRTSPTKGGIC